MLLSAQPLTHLCLAYIAQLSILTQVCILLDDERELINHVLQNLNS